jgi:TolB protein
LGWVPTQFLMVSAPLADLPAAPKLPIPDQSTPANQPAAAPAVQGRPISESKLVFQLASGGDIMVINPDGTGLHRLTAGIDPVLSPDGQTVAFTRWQGETGSLWLINIDGTNERQLVGFIKQAKGPAWSPDGAQIVLNFQYGGELQPETTCETLRKNGHSPRPPGNAYDVGLKIKNGLPRLCWTTPGDPHWSLRVVNVADGSFEDLNGGQYAFRPTWDPGQPSRIVDDAGDGLWAIAANGQNHSNLTNDIDDGSPVFSPDGRYLAVTHGQQGGNQGYDIFRLNRDGSGRVRLTETPLWVPVVPDGDHKQWNNVAPAWSPDSSQIAFLTDRTGRWEIWVMNADGSNQHPLFSDTINNQLHFTYNFVDERMLSWR